MTVNCEGAHILDVEDVEDALERTAAVHPKRPNLRTTWQEEEMLSPYQEVRTDHHACTLIDRAILCFQKLMALLK